MKDALTEWRDKLQTKGKYLQITHNKAFMSRIYKELSNPTIENTLKKKKAKYLNKNFTKEDIGWQISTWKDVYLT